MKPTLIHMPPGLIEQLDEHAGRAGVSRSHLVREAVSAYLRTEATAELADRVASAYEEQPLSTPDEWGDLETFLEAVRQARRDEP